MQLQVTVFNWNYWIGLSKKPSSILIPCSPLCFSLEKPAGIHLFGKRKEVLLLQLIENGRSNIWEQRYLYLFFLRWGGYTIKADNKISSKKKNQHCCMILIQCCVDHLTRSISRGWEFYVSCLGGGTVCQGGHNCFDRVRQWEVTLGSLWSKAINYTMMSAAMKSSAWKSILLPLVLGFVVPKYWSWTQLGWP